VEVSGQTTVTLHAGQQVAADRNGKLGSPQSIQPDRQDPYQLEVQCSNAVSAGTTAGTVQSTDGGPITTGQTAEVDYESSGGTVSAALCWPGSVMTLTVTDPAGAAHTSRGAPATVIRMSGPPGLWRAIVRGVNVPTAEPFVVAFATDVACAGQAVDSGGVVRQTLSNGQLARSLGDSGVTGITIQVQGTSPTSARVYYAYSGYGVQFSWTIDFYAATPNLGYVFTQVTFHGINVTTQVISRINAAGAAVTSIPQDYTVDRVYSCNGPDGDMMVIEGHR
jgi:hypothetical protein